MFVTGWLHANSWMVGCLTSRLAGSVAGWQYGWLALRLIIYMLLGGCWLCGCWLCGSMAMWLTQ